MKYIVILLAVMILSATSVLAAECGDGLCEDDEGDTCSANFCPADCGIHTTGCGDCICDDTSGENYKNCPADCPVMVICGDNLCDGEADEDINTCPEDCKIECVEDWICTEWSDCVGGLQTRECKDNNNCGTTNNKPDEIKKCVCTESWTCTEWGYCVDGQQTRTCTDQNNCGTTYNKPVEIQACSAVSFCGDGVCDPDEDCKCVDCDGKRAQCPYEYVCNYATGSCQQNFCQGKGYECCNDWDCDDENINTDDTCINPSTLNSKCTYTPIDLSGLCDKESFKIAFILLTEGTPDPADIEKINKIKDRVADDFSYATENFANMDTSYPVTVIDYASLNLNMSIASYEPREVTREFYKSNPDEFDFIAIYTDSTEQCPGAGFGGTINILEGITNPEVFKPGDDSKYYGSNHKLLGFIDLCSIKERFLGVFTEEEIIRGRSSLVLHEAGHHWCCYVGDPYNSEGERLEIRDDQVHWNPYFDHGPSPLAIHSSRTYWEEEEGVFSSSTAYNRAKYHPFMLYFMGLKKPEEITEEFKLITPEGDEWFDEENQKVFVLGSVDYVTIQDVIDVVGPRLCAATPMKSKVPLIETEASGKECNGCLLQELCIPFGTRRFGEYCDLDREFKTQKKSDETCDNNYECESNLCIAGKCVSANIWQRFLNWINRLF